MTENNWPIMKLLDVPIVLNPSATWLTESPCVRRTSWVVSKFLQWFRSLNYLNDQTRNQIKVPEKWWRGIDINYELSVFSSILAKDSPTKLLIEHLHAVTNAENRQTCFEQLRVIGKGVGSVYRTGSSGYYNGSNWKALKTVINLCFIDYYQLLISIGQ